MFTIISLLKNKKLRKLFLFLILFALITQTPAQSTWTKQNPGTILDLFDIIWTGNIFVAVGGTYPTTKPYKDLIIYSKDGKNWNIAVSNTNTSSVKVEPFDLIVSNNTNFLALSSYHFRTSPDGIKWSESKELKKEISSNDLQCFMEIVWTGDKFIGVGRNGGITTSKDGINWSENKNKGFECYEIFDLVWSGNIFVAAGYAINFTSTDGESWDFQGGQEGTGCETITWTGSKFFGVSSKKLAYSSTDGISWSDRIVLPRPDTTLRINPVNEKKRGYDNFGRIRWTGEELIYVKSIYLGSNVYGCYICTSTDGITWTLQSDRVEGELSDIAWNDNMFVAVGRSGTILTSPRKNTTISEKYITKKNINNDISIRTTSSKLYASLPSVLENKSVSIGIYNISGKKVFLQNSHISGSTIEYDLTNIPSGYYTFVAKSKEFEVKNKFLLTR